jgi:hypothetical protein
MLSVESCHDLGSMRARGGGEIREIREIRDRLGLGVLLWVHVAFVMRVCCVDV